ncbi:2-hydroxyacid dehydrogenase [Catellatospora tritici]|uniref:2-hydroxyacid dehydrogenase n=1 Tax=Catellatospora tritici TaxID=2851566 RepID=UPI001C2D793E|nr:2-hydroxyacid dehydrogenase [Catellatospora tritici]MBV1848753.1 2-hydroxyacid dehydrogenase [Catellatospora tritici]
MQIWIPHEAGRELMGPLPAGAEVDVLARADDPFPGDPAGVEFWVPPFLSTGDAVRLAASMPNLKVVQLLSAGADAWAGRLAEGVLLCDARGVHDGHTAEWIVAAILSSLRRFDHYARAQADHRWSFAEVTPTDVLEGKRVLIVGAGSIGAATAARLAPFEVELTYAARTARPGVHGVDELPDLLPYADIVVLLVPLTAQTRGMVDAAFLAAMPDGSLLVNAARGPVVETGALLKELNSGRLWAAVDVTEPEPLPSDHPLWDAPNLLLTPHVAGTVRGLLTKAYRLVGEQLRSYAAGDPVTNQVHEGY